jgi:hypothetical protein
MKATEATHAQNTCMAAITYEFDHVFKQMLVLETVGFGVESGQWICA